MDINKRNRTELKEFFNEGDKPTEKQFGELIDANINQMEDGIAKVPGNPLAIMAEGDTAGSQELLHLYTDFKQDNPNWSVNMHPRINPDEPTTAIPGLNIKDAAGKSRLFIQSNKGNVGVGTIEPDSKLTIEGDNDTSLVSVIDATQERAKIFEVSQEEGNGLVAVRNGKANESVQIKGDTISFEDAKDSSNIKSAKIASEEGTLKIYGKSSDKEATQRTLEIVADEMTVTGNIAMNNLSASPSLQDGGEASDRKIPSQRAVKTYVDTRLPQGLISMWSGNEIPTGWALCDGTNGTPDLRGRFIVGLNENNNDYNKIGNTGGSEKVQLKVQEIPAHNHTGNTSEIADHTHNISHPASGNDSGNGLKTITMDGETHGALNTKTKPAGKHKHSFTTNQTGGNQSHENRPPYFVLAYIMKL
ncbi:phage baseplate protein [Aquimarina mytili]|uniref:Baseplate structural protein Gp10 C-terminal domain-containing protein n=1 Tax=Aquimarina mytili TaxID=874423 RepID=A0A936ZR39_9FLAO|nr:hypothetical protein [Aquimarina mytili]MBL0683867.1 hypothetical protein [Aquimarina mytili]